MTADIQSFIEKARQSLEASKLLFEHRLYDFAGSRAYYTMFYIAEAFLWQKELSFSSHSAVISAFGREITKTGIAPIEFHRHLIDAQDKRTQGDYNIDDTVKLSQEDAQKLIMQSEEFIQMAMDRLL